MRIAPLLAGLLLPIAGCQCPRQSTATQAPPAAITVYCTLCGVLSGKVTDCPLSRSHSFSSASATAKVVCAHCGVEPSEKPTDCPHRRGHEFTLFGK